MFIYPTNDARAVANYLLNKAGAEQRHLDPMKLLKLTYISHGWHLGLTEQPLFFQRVFAWPYGPVIPEVYRAFSKFGYSPIERPAVFYDQESKSWTPFVPSLADTSRSIVDQVWEVYKGFTATQLSDMTHQPGSPWATVTAGMKPADIRDVLIPNSVIQPYYRALALRNQQRNASSGQPAST